MDFYNFDHKLGKGRVEIFINYSVLLKPVHSLNRELVRFSLHVLTYSSSTLPIICSEALGNSGRRMKFDHSNIFLHTSIIM